VLTFNYRFFPIKSICWGVLLVVLSIGLFSCSDRLEVSSLSSPEQPAPPISAGKLSEVAPPAAIQELRQSLEQYQPQVAILSPQTDQVFQDTTISVQLQVRDLPIYKDPDWEMGPHLKMIVDNEPAQEVYGADKPIILEKLTPGTHTLRVFASRPWHESFKNEGAYAQTTFHILTKTGSNTPDPSLPLLTYSYPQGNYGAEPILLDFYLTNAPLRLLARETPENKTADWRIRVTVNGQNFVLDNWQSVYLTGFEKGNNWVQLEFLDARGNRVDNLFNNTVRLITYTPKGQDTLSKLMRGELSAEYARAIVDPTYKAKLTPIPEETPTAEPEVPSTEPSPIPQETLTPVTEPEIPSESLGEPSKILVPQEEKTSTVQLKTPPEESIEPIESAPSQEETSTSELDMQSELSESPSEPM